MKLTTILIAVMLFSTKIFAQDTIKMKDDKTKKKKPVHVKTIDFLNDPRNLRDDTVRYNHKYSYVLKNINKFVYKEATAEEKGENLNIERPEVLKAIKFPGFISTGTIKPKEDEEPAPTPDTSMNIRNSKEAKAKRDKEVKEMNAEIDRCNCIDVKKFINTIPSLNNSLKIIQEKGDKFEEMTKTFSTFSGLNRAMEKLKKETQMTWGKIDTVKRVLLKDSLGLVNISDTDKGAIIEKYNTLRISSVNLYAEIGKEANNISNTLDSVGDKYKECLFNMQRNMRCLDSCCRNPIKGKVCKLDSIFKSKEDSLLYLKNCMKKMEEFSAGLKNDIKEAKSAIEVMEKTIGEGKIEELENNYFLLVDKNFELELESFKADKDIHEITFTAKAEGPLVFGKPATRTIKINAVTYGGLKIDYSTGAFLNRGNNKFLGPEYYFENPSDSTKIIREAGRTKKGLLSIGALMHLSYRTNCFLRPAVSIGVSASSGFDALNFHGGLSLILGRPGKVNRAILTYGFTWREVDLLNSRYSLNVERKDYPDAVPTSKNFPIRGHFFSVTYNLTGINK